jgi:alkanesulfonate monooxygenase SsuD/methylene tetrahydromethanopterin reductase-like flavin-dependent oxidoreductase (luciferase family)
MRFAIDTPNFGDYSEPRLLTELAREAEIAGWDGFFLWDHIGASWPVPICDPWIALAAMAMATERIKLGTLVTPLPRRRPWKLARETVTLDHLSHGRLILGVGIGSDNVKEYSCFGEADDDRLHGAMLDEGLDILLGLWSGEPFSYSGKYYSIEQAHFQPPPVQSPRIPIWVADVWPHKRPLRRAADWDGIVPFAIDRALTPDEIHSMVSSIRERRVRAESFDVAFGFPDFEKNLTPDCLQAYTQAGVTWWLECSSWNHSLADVRERIRRGPPRDMLRNEANL